MLCKRSVRDAVLFLFVAGLIPTLTGCGDPPSSSVAETESGQTAVAAVDGPAPPFTLEDLDGNAVSLSDSAGQVRLLDFWATWCAPCREEIPMLNELHEKFGERGLLILAISDIDEDAEVVRPFVDEHGVIYRNLIGTEDVVGSYKVLGLPTAYLIDGDGTIVKKFFGPKPPRILEAAILELLESTPAT